jgi:hypothetical protein
MSRSFVKQGSWQEVGDHLLSYFLHHQQSINQDPCFMNERLIPNFHRIDSVADMLQSKSESIGQRGGYSTLGGVQSDGTL